MSAKNLKSVVAMVVLLAFTMSMLVGVLPASAAPVAIAGATGPSESLLPARHSMPMEGCHSSSGECPLG